MYNLLPNLQERDKHLLPTGKKFWVGVTEGIYPSPPISRDKTNCYSPADVYLYLDIQVFSMPKKDLDGKFCKVFYRVPENELKFIQ